MPLTIPSCPLRARSGEGSAGVHLPRECAYLHTRDLHRLRRPRASWPADWRPIPPAERAGGAAPGPGLSEVLCGGEAAPDGGGAVTAELHRGAGGRVLRHRTVGPGERAERRGLHARGPPGSGTSSSEPAAKRTRRPGKPRPERPQRPAHRHSTSVPATGQTPAPARSGLRSSPARPAGFRSSGRGPASLSLSWWRAHIPDCCFHITGNRHI
jgi:hypothetical protein